MIASVEEGRVDTKALLKDVDEVNAVSSINEEAVQESVKDYKNKIIVPDKCPICEMKIKFGQIKYYDVALLKKFMSVRAKIIPRSKSGVCCKHQKELKIAIKRARHLALLPFVDIGI